MITFCTEPRVSAINAIASRMPGIAINPSMIRIRMVSRRRMKPARMPMKSPVTEERIATEKPTRSDMRVPYNTRE